MCDYVVDGGTGRIWIALVSLFVWLSTVLQNNVLEYALNLIGCNARFDEWGNCTMAFGIGGIVVDPTATDQNGKHMVDAVVEKKN